MLNFYLQLCTVILQYCYHMGIYYHTKVILQYCYHMCIYYHTNTSRPISLVKQRSTGNERPLLFHKQKGYTRGYVYKHILNQ